MKIVKASYEILTDINASEILRNIEKAGRVCYKSEGNISGGSAEKFIKNIVVSGHEAVLEHQSISVRFIVDRGISHEIVRHRLASYCQESTRYCNYGQDRFGREITVIQPLFLSEGTPEYSVWKSACEKAEDAYFSLLDCGCTPQQARVVLPTCLKTELIMTANIREWRHFLKLRTAKDAHPQIRVVAVPLLDELTQKLPELFRDIAGGDS